MALPRGIRYFGGGGVTGYDQAALANVRLLVNAGLAVHWVPVEWSMEGMLPSRWWDQAGTPKPILGALGQGAATADAATLVARTLREIPCDTVIAHTPPETWPRMFRPDCRNLGCVAWETDAPPAHWLPLLQRAHALAVPSRHNRDALRRGGVTRPVHVVPHVRRHVFTEYAPGEIAEARAELGIPPSHTLFYSINAWDPRKNTPRLIEAFVRAFDADAPVTLLLKTPQLGYDAGPLYPQRACREMAERHVAALQAQLRRRAPAIVVHDEALDSAGIDLIHAAGDVFVSLSHGEGWGLGAFEAATLGTPVLITGGSGPTDFLGEDYAGLIPARAVAAPVWPPYQPSYFPSQRWAEPDLDAAIALLREAQAQPARLIQAAQRTRERIVERYGEPRLWQDWQAFLDA